MPKNLLDLVDFLIKLLIFHCSIGSLISKQSYQLYERVEERHAAAHTLPVKIVLGTVLIVFFSTALQPVSYAIVGYPPPQQWALPSDTQ